MKRILSIIALTALVALIASAQNGTLNPTNPPEPQLKYRLTVKAQPTGAATMNGGGEYAEGTQVTLQARPTANYVLRYWLCNGEQTEQTTSSFRIVMPANDVVYIAVFEYVEPTQPPFDPSNPSEPQVIAQEYPLYLVAKPAGAGTFNRTSGAKAKEGTSVTLRATPATGYQFVGWYNADDILLSTKTQFSYTMPAEVITLTARFTYSPGNPSEPSGNQDNVDITPAPEGDVNCDSVVDVADIASIIDVMATGDIDANADVNNDGVVDVADIATVIDIMAANARLQKEMTEE